MCKYDWLFGDLIWQKAFELICWPRNWALRARSILQKLKEEGLSDVAPNHMSTLSLGLAESVREWFSSGQDGGGGGTAVETAPPVEAATKPRLRSRKKKEDAAPPATDEIETPRPR